MIIQNRECKKFKLKGKWKRILLKEWWTQNKIKIKKYKIKLFNLKN